MFRHGVIVRGAVLALAALVLTGAPTAGQGTSGPPPGGEVGYRERNVWAVYREAPVEVPAPTVGLPRRPARFCLRLPLPNQEAPPTGQGPYTAAQMRELAARTPLDRTPGVWHTLLCYEVGEDLPYVVTLAVWNPADPAAGNGTTIDGVETFARDLLRTPAPVVVVSPPADRQVTGLETWFAVGAPVVAARTAQAGPLWATAEAIAVAIEIDPGDGTARRTCPLAGPDGTGAAPAPRTAPDCLRHTYLEVDRRTGTAARTAQVWVRYRVLLTSSDDPVPRVVDDLLGDVAALAVTVREIQTVLR